MIFTHYNPIRIPLYRGVDWVAHLGNVEPGDPIGFGKTEQEAIDHLVEQLQPVKP